MAKNLLSILHRSRVEKFLPKSSAELNLVRAFSVGQRAWNKVSNAALPETGGAPVEQEPHFYFGAFVDPFLMRMKNIDLLNNRKIWSRISTILPEFVGCTMRIYNRKAHVHCN